LIRYLKNIILTALFLGLIISNILTLLYQPFTTALSTAISTTFGIATVTSLLSDAIDLKDLELNRQKKSIAKKDNLIQKHRQAAVKKKAAIRRYGKAVTLRTKKLIKRTLANIPAESLPVIGTAVVLGGTAYEIYAACQNLLDIEDLYSEFQVEGGSGNSFINTVCKAYKTLL